MSANAVIRGIASLALCILCVGGTAAFAEPKEPEGYRTDHYRALTPAGVAGGTALGTPAAAALWKSGAAVWIDVLAAPRRPENLPSPAVWRPVPHRDIPGSLWLPDVGLGVLDARLEAYFRTNLERATKGRADAALVFYCLADCWMSWNAAKRAASWGYKRVYWFRDGTDGWQAARLPLANATPVPEQR